METSEPTLTSDKLLEKDEQGETTILQMFCIRTAMSASPHGNPLGSTDRSGGWESLGIARGPHAMG